MVRNTHQIIDDLITAILSNPDLNITWIPDSLERDVYHTLFGIIEPIIRQLFGDDADADDPKIDA